MTDSTYNAYHAVPFGGSDYDKPKAYLSSLLWILYQNLWYNKIWNVDSYTGLFNNQLSLTQKCEINCI